MDSPLSELQTRVKDLCVLLHTELSSLQESTADESFMSLSEVVQLDTISALDHIEAAIKELVGAKRQLLEMSQYSVVVEQEQYGLALQKLEGEVRGHIQAQHQMALHIELLQQKVEDMEKEKSHLISDYDSIVEKMRLDCEALKNRLKDYEEKTVKENTLRKGSGNKGKTIQDLQLRKLPKAHEQHIGAKPKDGDSARVKASLFDQTEWERMYQQLTKAREDLPSRESNHSDLSDAQKGLKKGDSKRPQTAVRREIQEIMKDFRGCKGKELCSKGNTRSISPLLANIRKDSAEGYKEPGKKLGQRAKGGKVKGRSASTDRLRNSKSSLGLVSSTLQQF